MELLGIVIILIGFWFLIVYISNRSIQKRNRKQKEEYTKNRINETELKRKKLLIKEFKVMSPLRDLIVTFACKTNEQKEYYYAGFIMLGIANFSLEQNFEGEVFGKLEDKDLNILNSDKAIAYFGIAIYKVINLYLKTQNMLSGKTFEIYANSKWGFSFFVKQCLGYKDDEYEIMEHEVNNLYSKDRMIHEFLADVLYNIVLKNNIETEKNDIISSQMKYFILVKRCEMWVLSYLTKIYDMFSEVNENLKSNNVTISEQYNQIV